MINIFDFNKKKYNDSNQNNTNDKCNHMYKLIFSEVLRYSNSDSYSVKVVYYYECIKCKKKVYETTNTKTYSIYGTNIDRFSIKDREIIRRMWFDNSLQNPVKQFSENDLKNVKTVCTYCGTFEFGQISNCKNCGAPLIY